MTSFKGYANDVENERVDVQSMCSFLQIDLNRFLECKNRMFNAWNAFKKNERIDSTLTLSLKKISPIT